MSKLLFLLGGLALLLVASFCAFGFLACFEPRVDRWYLGRMLYTLGLGTSLGAALQLARWTWM